MSANTVGSLLWQNATVFMKFQQIVEENAVNLISWCYDAMILYSYKEYHGFAIMVNMVTAHL